MATSTGVSEIGTCDVPMLHGTVRLLALGLNCCGLKIKPTNVSMEKRGGGEISDMSDDSVAAKSARERYIRVAAMDIMVSEGMRNIYLDKMTQYQLFVVGKKNIRDRMVLVFAEKLNSLNKSGRTDWTEEMSTV